LRSSYYIRLEKTEGRTIQRHWQHWVHKTHDANKQNTEN